MMDKKTVFLVLLALVVLISVSVQAETIKEKTFSDIGYEEGMVIEGANQQKCQEIIFYTEFNQEEFAIISIHFEFVPDVKGNAKIDVNLNDELISTIDSGEGKQFERIVVESKKLKEKNSLKMCGFSSDTITTVKVLSDSKIGNYKTAFFPERSFKKEVISKQKILGQEIEIKTTLKNYGNEKTYVEIIDGDADREDIELIKGKNSFKGEIQPGEEISLEFTYKLKNENTRILPNAKAFYLNQFGEKEKIESNYPEIVPLVYEKALEPIIMLKKQINSVGEESEIEVVIINNSLETIHNAEIKLVFPFLSGGITAQEQTKEFEAIHPNEIVYFKTKVKSVNPGEFGLGCEINFSGETSSCKETTIIFEENKLDQRLIIAIGMIIIGVIIYLYLYLR